MRLTIGSEDEPPKPFDGFIIEGTCTGVPSSFSVQADGASVHCMYKPGDPAASIAYQFRVPQDSSPSDYNIVTESESIPSCASYWRPSSPLAGSILEIGASSSNFSICTGKVDYVIQHLSGENISFTVGASHTLDP